METWLAGIKEFPQSRSAGWLDWLDKLPWRMLGMFELSGGQQAVQDLISIKHAAQKKTVRRSLFDYEF